MIAFLAAVAVGIPSLDGAFVRDDVDYIAWNPHVACPAGIVTAFSSSFQPLKPIGLYRPVTTLSLGLDVLLGGEEHHAIIHGTNLLLAGLSAALVAVLAWRLLLRVGGGAGGATRAAKLGALGAGLVMAVHPVRTEAVCWMSGRAENLMTFFALACLVVAAGRPAPSTPASSTPTWWRTALAAVLAFLSASSKEQGFALALLVPVVAPPVSRPRAIQAIAVAAALGLAFAMRSSVLGSVELRPGLAVFGDLGFGARLAQGLALFFDYVRLLVWPHPLLFEYDLGRLRVAGLLDARALAGLVLAAACVAGIARFRRQPAVAAGCALVLLPLVPVLHVLVPIGEDFAERFLALPAAGAAILAGVAIRRFPRAGSAIVLVAVVAGAVLFARRAADFKSERVLYEALVRAAPDSPSAKALLAIGLLRPPEGAVRPDASDRERAEGLLRVAVDADPDLGFARVQLAGFDAERRAAAGAAPADRELAFLAETARRFPRLPQAQGMLGAALFEAGRREEARAALEKEIANMPLDVEAPSLLARIHEDAGRPDAAAAVLAGARAAWDATWRKVPGFAPIAIGYARLLSDRVKDDAAARAVLAQSIAAATREKDRRFLEQEIARHPAPASSR